MWMTDYITEIQRQFIVNYNFPLGDNKLPKDVLDGAYPMIIDGELDLVLITGGRINCCNFIGKLAGLSEFQEDVRKKNISRCKVLP